MTDEDAHLTINTVTLIFFFLLKTSGIFFIAWPKRHYRSFCIDPLPTEGHNRLSNPINPMVLLCRPNVLLNWITNVYWLCHLGQLDQHWPTKNTEGFNGTSLLYKLKVLYINVWQIWRTKDWAVYLLYEHVKFWTVVL